MELYQKNILNNFSEYRNKVASYENNIMELESYADNKSLEVEKLYTKAFAKYDKNRELISIKYKVNDKSGLAKHISINGNYRVELDMPNKKRYTYNKFIPNEYDSTYDTRDINKKLEAINNIHLDIKGIKYKIDLQCKKDMEEYKKYVSKAFKDYSLVGSLK